MRALITGADGFVGTHLAQHLESSGDTVIATSLQGEIKLDVTDRLACAEILEQFQPEVIYHLAAISFVPQAENHFEQVLQVNVSGTYNIIRAARAVLSAPKLVFISSAEVYGKITPKELPLTEGTELRPANNYSLSKAMAEQVVNRYLQSGAIEAVILRPFNHIGSGQDNRFVAASFAYQLAQIVQEKTPPVMKVGNLAAKRDFSHVKDIVQAYRLAALHGKGTYNLCSGQTISIQSILDTLRDIAGIDIEVQEDPARMRPSEVPEIYGSYDRAAKELGWKPEISLRQALEEAYQFWLNR